MRSRLAELFAPMSMDGLFLDSPYTLPAFTRGDEGEEDKEIGPDEEGGLHQAVLPPAFGPLCPLLAPAATAATAVPDARGRAAGPWGEDTSTKGEEWSFDRRAHAAVVVDVDCQRLRLSLSDGQALLLRELLRALAAHGGGKPPGEDASASDEADGAEEPAAAAAAKPVWSRLRVASLRLHTVTLSLSQHAPDALSLSATTGAAVGASPFFPSSSGGPSWVFLRLAAWDMTVDWQALATAGGAQANDVRVGLAGLEVAYAGEPEADASGEKESSEEEQQQAATAAVLAPAIPMRLLLQWGREGSGGGGDALLQTAAPALLEALHARTLRAKGGSKKPVADVMVDAPGLRPAPGSILAARQRTSVKANLDGPLAASVVLEVLLGDERQEQPLHLHCTPAALVGLGAFFALPPAAPTSPPIAAGNGSSVAVASQQPRFRSQFRIPDIQLSFTALGGRPPCTVRARGLMWGTSDDGRHQRTMELASLCLTAGPDLPLLETEAVTLALTSTKEAAATTTRLSTPKGLRLTVLPAHWRLLSASVAFARRCFDRQTESPEELLAAHVRALALRRAPSTFVRVCCTAAELLHMSHGGQERGEDVLRLGLGGLVVEHFEDGQPASAPFPHILRTPRVEMEVATGREIRTVSVRAPQLLDASVSPLKLAAFKQAVVTLSRVAAEMSQSSSKGKASASSSINLKEEVRVVAEEFTVHVDLPWLAQELPAVLFTCQRGAYSSRSRSDDPFIHHTFTAARVRAEGQGLSLPPPVKHTPAALLGLAHGRLASFLSPDEQARLAAVLSAAAGPPAPAAMTIPVPILLPLADGDEEDNEEAAAVAGAAGTGGAPTPEPFFQMAWHVRRETRVTVHMEIDFGRCVCLLYFPLLYSLIRLGTLATTTAPARRGLGRRRTRSRARTGDSIASQDSAASAATAAAVEPSTLVLRAQPSRVLVLAGNLPEARFALEFRLGPFCMWRRSDGPCGEAPMELRRLSFTSAVGQWRLEAQQGLVLSQPWPLTDRVDLEVEEGSGKGEAEAGTARVVQVSPIALRVGSLELAVLYRAIGVFGRSVTRAPPLEEELRLEEEAGVGVAPEDVDEEKPNLRMACSYLVLSFKTPRALTAAVAAMVLALPAAQALDDAAVAFHLTLENVALHVGHWAGGLRVQEAILRDCRPRGQLALVTQPSTEAACLALSWCKWVGGRYSDVCIALPRPATVRLDPAAAALLGRLGSFVNVDLAGVGAAGGLSSPRSRQARRRGRQALHAATRLWRRTETIRVLGEDLKVVLAPPSSSVSSSEAEEAAAGLEFGAASLAFSYRTTATAFDQRLHLGQLQARVLSKDVPALPLLDPANATLTVEEGRPSPAAARTRSLLGLGADGDDGSAAMAAALVPPPVMALHMEPLQLHAHPGALAALRPVVSAFAPSSKPAASASIATTGALAAERCPTQTVPLSRLEMMVLEARREREPPLPPSHCAPGTLVARTTPALRTLPTTPPRDVAFLHVQGQEPPAGTCCYTALSWVYSVPVRAAAVSVPDRLLVRVDGPLPPAMAATAFPLVLELATEVEGEDAEGEEGEVMAAVARVSIFVQMVGDESSGQAPPQQLEQQQQQQQQQQQPRVLPCDHDLAGRAWQLSLFWDGAQQALPPLEWLWRPLALTLADHVALEVVAPASDRLAAVLQLAVPHALVRLYPLSSEGGEQQEGQEEEELGLVSLKDVSAVCRVHQGRGPLDMSLRAGSLDADVLDAARWTLLPALRGEGVAMRYRGGKAECRLLSTQQRAAEVKETGPPSLALSLVGCRVNVSHRILSVVGALRRDWQALPAPATATRRPRPTWRRYRLVNRTRHALWLSQHLTNETVCIPARAEKAYSWRAVATHTPRLLVRFALNIRGDSAAADAAPDGPSVWSEPVEADMEGARCVSLRTSDEGLTEDVALLLRRAGSHSVGSAGSRVRLWLVVEKRGLETRLVLWGGCELRNFLPVPLDLRLAPPKQQQQDGLEVKQALEYVRLEAARAIGQQAGLPSSSSSSYDSLLIDEAFMDGPANTGAQQQHQQQHQQLIVVQARTASSSDFGQAMMLGLPGAVGVQQPCSSTGGVTGGVDPWENAYHPAWSTTALGQAPGQQPHQAPAQPQQPQQQQQPIYFLCHLRRVAVRPQGSGDAPVWGWLSLEVWPLAYFANAAAPAQYRLLAWGRLEPKRPPLPAAAAEPLSSTRGGGMTPLMPGSPAHGEPLLGASLSSSASMSVSVSGSAGGAVAREVDAARRMLEEKIQRLSYKRLQEGTALVAAEGEEDSSGSVGLKTPTTKSVDLLGGGGGSEDGASWRRLPAGAAPMALTTADPRHGLALSLRASPESSPTFFSSMPQQHNHIPQKTGLLVPSHRLLAWVRGGGAALGAADALALMDERPVPLTDAGPAGTGSSTITIKDALARGFVPIAMRKPASMGPSLLLRLVPSLTVANHCPFPVSLVALTPRHPGLPQPLSSNTTIHEGKDAATAGSEFGGFNEAGLQVVGAGQEAAAEAWAWPAGSPVPVLAVGVTTEKEGAGVLRIREARREEPWRQQGWSKPLALATLLGALQEQEGAGGWAEMSMLVPVKEALWLPLVLRLVPRPLTEGAEGIGGSSSGSSALSVYRIEVRPRLVLHSAVAVPAGAAISMRYASAAGWAGEEEGSCLYHPLLPFSIASSGSSSNSSSSSSSSSLASQIVLVRRAARLEGEDAGWMSPEKGSPVRLPHPAQGSGSPGEAEMAAAPPAPSGGEAAAVPLHALPESPSPVRGRTVSAAFKRIWCRAVHRPPPLDDEDIDEEEDLRGGGGIGASSQPGGAAAAAAVFVQTLELCLVPTAAGALAHAAAQPFSSISISSSCSPAPCSPLVLAALDEDLKEIQLGCARPGPGLWGLNGKDVVALKVGVEYHQGTHHLLVSVDPATPLVLLNRSVLLDVCLGLEKRSRQSSIAAAAPPAPPRRGSLLFGGGGGTQLQNDGVEKAVAIPSHHTVRVAAGGRVEWDPQRPPLRLKSVARDARSTAAGELAPSRESSVDDSMATVSAAGARVANSGAGAAAAAGVEEGGIGASGSGVPYRRSTFPTKHAPVLTYRLQGCLSNPNAGGGGGGAMPLSAWSTRLYTEGRGGEAEAEQEEQEVVELAFPAGVAPTRQGSRNQEEEEDEAAGNAALVEEGEEMENHVQELQRALVRTGRAVLTVRAAQVAGMCCLVIEDAASGPRSRSGSMIAAAAPPQQKPQVAASSLEVSVRASTLEIQLLEDEAVLLSDGGAARGSSSNSKAGATAPREMRLPASLFTRIAGLECRYYAGPLGAAGPVRGYRTVEVSLQDLQTDHLAPDAEFPVVLACLHDPPQPLHHAEKEEEEEDRLPALAFRYCEAALDPAVVGPARPRSYVEALSLYARARLRVSVDGSLLHTVTAFQVRMLGDHDLGMEEEGEEDDDDNDAGSKTVALVSSPPPLPRCPRACSSSSSC